MDTTKSCIITFFGKPNVGKSTLFNALQNNVYAIISKKAQTTRNNILAKIEVNENEFLILYDTPGFHKTNNKLDLFLNSEVKTALKQADIACFICDPTRKLNEEDFEILNYFEKLKNIIKVLIINKADLCDELTIKQFIETLTKQYHFDQQFIISAYQKTNLDQLKDFFIKNLKPAEINPALFTEPDDKFITKEIIRESCLENLQQEVPHSISVIINQFQYNHEVNILDIDASIYCERDSQKAIIVGKQGNMIKQIGICARKKLLNIYDCKINLKLYVKTKNDWRNNDELIISMGYKK